ncbi:MAG TPA: TylF/MycF/NovP-related O-methyltransferase [Candidatus Acidoferrales bacterium]|nr:TylF/MycF/NovP-related O-methyltransferase [Candidatus Acidoferrales bacterium]
MPVNVFDWFLVPYLSQDQKAGLVASGDPVRYGTIFLSLEKINTDNIPGSIAECGVYKGVLSKFLHKVFPERQLFLFDTFRGFDTRDPSAASDDRFKDTSVESVLDYIGDTTNIVVRKGYFPETATGLENEKFSFVMVDFDKYEPTLAALDFFYPRTHKGGFIFVHDYNSPESDWGCSKALNLFLSDKPEKPVSIPDSWGTALFRKI